MAHADLIRTNEGLPTLPDISELSDSDKITVLYQFVRQQQDYIVRLRDQIGYELKQNKEG